MNFGKAVNEMLKGNKVTLKLSGHCDWRLDKNDYLFIKDGSIMWSNDRGTLKGYAKSSIDDSAISSTGWTLWESPNKKKAKELREQAEKLTKQALELEKSI